MGPWHDLLNEDITKLDQLLYSAMSSANSSPWENATVYTIGTTVIDTDDSSTWMCNADHTSAATGTFSADRAAHPTYWIQLLAGFAPRGEWQNSTNYYPYDLAYQSALGIFAQCKTFHVSNASGSIKDDAVHWFFIYDMSTVTLATATTVTYDPTVSGLGVTNVQAAIDKIETQIVSLNNVNVTQGNQITALQSADTASDTRLTAVETKNTAQDTQITNLQTSVSSNTSAISTLDGAAVKLVGGQNISGGFSVTSKSLGNLTSFTVNPLLGNYQYGNNIAAFTITAPAVDCGVDLLIINGAGAAIPTLNGFSVNLANVGDPFTTTNGQKFLVSMRRIGGIATYTVKALQ
jgi:hypothetical protein